ncbi:peroxiredoxin [bacterium]|nr:peroxiredoxin [bacterium]|tara:strand:+ start:4403 stop:4840 length:438 start_codon:yes stop_codon:yes gene_type:complete
MVEINEKAIDFTLENQDGIEIKLSDFIGQKILIYFYPKDMTSGCTKQACSLQDNMVDLNDLNLKIFGISKDSVESHKKFQEKHELEFDLLADTQKEVIKSYGALKGPFTARIAFLIDEKGTVIHKFSKVDTKIFAQDVINVLNSL